MKNGSIVRDEILRLSALSFKSLAGESGKSFLTAQFIPEQVQSGI
jgi:hypothetical protein